MEKRPVVHAYVLKDGSVIPADYLQRYAVKQSKQIPQDQFSSIYEANNLIAPLYNPDSLAQLTEMNTYHYRAVKTKAKDTVGLGWKLVPVDGVQNPNLAQKQRAMDFLNNPHPDYTLEEILTQWMEDFEALGNGYLELIRENNQLVGLAHIPAQTMRRHADGVRYVQVRGARKRWFKKVGAPFDVHFETGEIVPLGSLPEEVRGNEVLHIFNYSSRSDYYGVPDVIPALGALIGDKYREEYNIDFFENFAVPAYAVTVAGAELDDQTKQTIQQYFQKDLKENRHATLVLTAPNPIGDGPAVEFKFERLAVDINEASFRLYRVDNRDEIIHAHGIPPYRVGINETGSLGGTTAKESTEIYKQSVVKPRQNMVEARLNKHILRNSLGITDWVLKFNEIDTRDEDREVSNMSTLFEIGGITPNEIRERIGKARIDHPLMDVPFIKGVPITQVEQQPEQLISEIKSLHKRLLDVVMK